MARKASLLIIFLTVFIDLVGFGIVLPMLPLYSKEFGASGLAAGGIVATADNLPPLAHLLPVLATYPPVLVSYIIHWRVGWMG